MALIERYDEEKLFAGNTHPATVNTITVASGEGVLERGTLLGRNSEDKFVMMTSLCAGASIEPEYVLAVDCDATSADVVADAYATGDFWESGLKAGDGYTVSEADRLSLKKVGIYLVEGQE